MRVLSYRFPSATIAASFTDGDRDMVSRFYMFILAAIFLLTGCDNKPDAPFGFKWGQTIQQTIDQKLAGTKVNNTGFVGFISADTAPKPASFEGRYFLGFMGGLGLTSVSFSTPVEANGYFFNQGRKVYGDMSQKLEQKYGSPVEIKEKVSRDGADFYECIKDESCGTWQRKYQKDGMTITLNVEPSPGRLMDAMSKGYVSVRYEFVSKEELDKEVKRYKDKKESNNF